MGATEVIVVASGDRHGTERAVAGRARFLWPAGSTRAFLMNTGAASARGEVLFFLHQLGGYKDVRILEDLDVTQRLRRVGRTIIVRVPMRTSGRRFLTRGPWRTFFFIVWLLLLHTLRLDTQQYAERWRGPADSPPGSSWRSGHLRNTVKPTHDGGC